MNELRKWPRQLADFRRVMSAERTIDNTKPLYQKRARVEAPAARERELMVNAFLQLEKPVQRMLAEGNASSLNVVECMPLRKAYP